MENLKYPIGRFAMPAEISEETIASWIQDLEELPGKLSLAIEGLAPEQLDTPYRPDGWSVRQVVHHVADASINLYTRLKLGLTETDPTIKPFDEVGWANLTDSTVLSPDVSISLLKSLHQRAAFLFRSLKPEDLNRLIIHPEAGPMSLAKILAIYAWHGKHHTAHITSLRERQGW